jgi:hypothetical protein
VTLKVIPVFEIIFRKLLIYAQVDALPVLSIFPEKKMSKRKLLVVKALKMHAFCV